METTNLGSQIKKYRQLRGLTQKQLAEKCGITDRQQVRKYENGSRMPSIGTLYLIGQVLEVELILQEKS